jgi:hypothetical protein
VKLGRIGYGLLGLLLIPAGAGLARGLFRLLVQVHLQPGGGTLLLQFFLGAGFWALVFSFLGRPLRSYVLAHELSHALAALLSGARVGKMKIGSRGGSVVVSHSNLWIALAPYLIPFYSLLLLILHASASLFWDPSPWRPWLPFALGLTWSFHLSFTLYALSLGQRDIQPYGAWGAYPVILVGNLLVLAAALFLASAEPLHGLRVLFDEQFRAYGTVLNWMRPPPKG